MHDDERTRRCAISAAVPRSGCTATSPTGSKISPASSTSDSQPGGSGRSCRYQAHIIGTASFMISEGWKRMQSEVEPALRAHADVADAATTKQQEDADRVQPRRRAAQKVGLTLREHSIATVPSAEAHDRAHDRGQALAGGAVEHDEAVGGDQREADHQRPVDLQRGQHARRAGQGAPGAGPELTSS